MTRIILIIWLEKNYVSFANYNRVIFTSFLPTYVKAFWIPMSAFCSFIVVAWDAQHKFAFYV